MASMVSRTFARVAARKGAFAGNRTRHGASRRAFGGTSAFGVVALCDPKGHNGEESGGLMEGSVIEGLVSRIKARLERFPEPAAFASDGEARGVWRREGLSALASLAERGALVSLDSAGQRLVDSLIEVAEGEL